jgi:hypothetical protein
LNWAELIAILGTLVAAVVTLVIAIGVFYRTGRAIRITAGELEVLFKAEQDQQLQPKVQLDRNPTDFWGPSGYLSGGGDLSKAHGKEEVV